MEVPEYLKRATKYLTNLKTIAMVRRTRQIGDKTFEETHYYPRWLGSGLYAQGA